MSFLSRFLITEEKKQEYKARQVLNSQVDIVRGYLNSRLNSPIIAITGQYTPLTVGFLIDIKSVGDDAMPCPVVSDYYSLETKLAFGRIWPYSSYILEVMYKLSAPERWLFINSVDSFPRMSIPLVGDEPGVQEPTYEQFILTLTNNKFFEHIEKL